MYSLQNYTTYSVLSGTKLPAAWAQRAADLGYKSLGVCDKQSLGGLIEFQTECLKRGIKPIMGSEFHLVDNAALRADAVEYGVVLLYAINADGFRNLIRLNNFSQSRDGGFYYRPRIDLGAVEAHSDGLICIAPPVDGCKDPEVLYRLNSFFKRHFMVGVNPMLSAHSEFVAVSKGFAAMPYRKVLVFDCHFPEASDAGLYAVVRKLDNGRQPKSAHRDVDTMAFLPDLEVLSTQIEEIHPYITNDVLKECLDSLAYIEETVEFEIPTGEFFIPPVGTKFGSPERDIVHYVAMGCKTKLQPGLDIEGVETLEQLLERMDGDAYPFEHTNKGESESALQPLSVYKERLVEEFDVVGSLGFFKYFHVVHDICSFCDKNGLQRGFARGSAAGSLVSYLLNITRVDPIRHSLLFSRFLNADRRDLPDIDLDFASDARDAVKVYIQERYGANRVVAIGTYTRLKVKSGVKSIAAAYGYGVPADDGSLTTFDFRSITDLLDVKDIPQTARGDKELELMIEHSEVFAAFYHRHKHWFDTVVMPLQETVVNTGIHAAGTLILPEDIDDCVPVDFNSRQNIWTTQWEGPDCEKRGFVKYDLLTVEGVDVVGYAKRLIERSGKKLPELEDVPLDDEKTLSIFNAADTEGIFQFKTYSQQAYLAQLKPTTFEHLVAAIALIRPGAMEANAHEEFAKIVNGVARPHYDHPDLIPILEDTEGLLIYQETMMQVVQAIGGLTGPQADHARKAAGKKKLDEMAKWESVFKDGGLAAGYDKDLLDDLWFKISAFAEYSFNRSHSVAYTLLSYYQAYIKARFPMEFWAAVMKYAPHDKKHYNSIYSAKARAESEGIEFVFPTIYGFADDFEPDGQGRIYWPLGAIAGLGDKAVAEITRGGRNSFRSMEDFVSSVDGRVIHKGIVGKLIQAGFFSPVFDKPYEAAQEYYRLRRVVLGKNDEVPYELAHKNQFRWVKLRNEAFGMIVQSWKSLAPVHKNVSAFKGDSMRNYPGRKVLLAGIVESIRTRQTKRGGWYARMTLVDDGEEYAVMMWPEFWEDTDLDRKKIRPKEGQLIEIGGVVDVWNGRPQLSVAQKGAYVRTVWEDGDF